MSVLLEIGIFAVVLTIALGCWIMVRWSRVQAERVASTRRREEFVDQLARAGEKALDPDPATSLEGLRKLGSLYDQGALEPEDDEYVEEIANTVLVGRLGETPDDEPLVLVPETGVQEVQDSRIVLPNELLAAMLAADIAAAHGREPSPLAHRIANASPAAEPPQTDSETAQLKRSA